MSTQYLPNIKPKNSPHSISSAPDVRPNRDLHKYETLQILDLSDKDIPTAPYIPRLHTTLPYPLRGPQVEEWRTGHHWQRGCPFRSEEQDLQYSTFLKRKWDDTYLTVEATWNQSDESPAIDDNPTKPIPETTKKKLTLNDYKMLRTKSASSSSAEDQVSVNYNADSNGVSPEMKKAARDGNAQLLSSQLPDKRGEKRTLQASIEIQTLRVGPPSSRDSPPAAKRARLFHSPRPVTSQPQPGPETKQKKKKKENKQPTKPNRHGLPPMLSPTLPAHAFRDLPPLLSPTLPASIEKDLLNFREGDGGPVSISSSAIHQSQTRREEGQSRPVTKANIDVGTKANGPAIRQPSPVDKVGRKPKLIVKLKFGRNRRKDVQRILNMTPRPTKSDISHASVPPVRQKDQARRIDTPERTEKVGEKRPRLAEDEKLREPACKRSKPPPAEVDLSKTKSVAVQPSLRSPASAPTEGKIIKPPDRTSVALKSVDMRRVESCDANARTPSMSRGTETPSQPQSTEKPHMNGDSRTAASSVNSKELDAMTKEHLRVFGIARRLKHEAEALLKLKTVGATPADEPTQKRGAALLVESVYCWILVFALKDECHRLNQRRADPGQWRSIWPFWNVVVTSTRAFPSLHGLSLQMGAVCHEIIHALDLERIRSSTYTDNSTHTDNSTCTDNSTAAFLNDFVREARTKRQCWIDGISKLSAERMQREFPETLRRSRGAVPLAKTDNDKLIPGQYEGSFYLPLSSVSTAVETVRAAASILAEWTKKEGVDWKALLEG